MEQTFESRFLAARRAVIAARFQNLNAMQLEGVLTTQGPPVSYTHLGLVRYRDYRYGKAAVTIFRRG